MCRSGKRNGLLPHHGRALTDREDPGKEGNIFPWIQFEKDWNPPKNIYRYFIRPTPHVATWKPFDSLKGTREEQRKATYRKERERRPVVFRGWLHGSWESDWVPSS